jgi:fucose permease
VVTDIRHPPHPGVTEFDPAEATTLERALRTTLALRGLVITIFGAVLPAAMATFGLSNAQASLLPLVGGLGAIMAALSVGSLMDRWGARRTTLSMAWALLLASLILGSAPAWPFFVAGAFLTNWGAGGMSTVNSVLLALVYRGRSGAAFNRNFLFVGIGSLISPLLTGAVLATTGSWRWAFAALAAAFAGMIATAWRVPYPPPEPRAAKAGATGERPWWQRRALILCALSLVCYVGAEVGLTTWAARFLVAERGAPIPLSATVVSIFWGGMILGRYGFSRLLRPGNEKKLVGLAGTVAAGAVVAFIGTPGAVWPILALAIGGLAFGGLWPTVMSYAAARAVGYTGIASGVLIALGFIGALTVPAAVGVLSTWVGLGTALGVSAASIALSTILFALA